MLRRVKVADHRSATQRAADGKVVGCPFVTLSIAGVTLTGDCNSPVNFGRPCRRECVVLNETLSQTVKCERSAAAARSRARVHSGWPLSRPTLYSTRPAALRGALLRASRAEASAVEARCAGVDVDRSDAELCSVGRRSGSLSGICRHPAALHRLRWRVRRTS